MFIINKIKQFTALKCLKGLTSGPLDLALSACSDKNNRIPPGSKLVRCKILKPDGTPASGKISVSMHWEKGNFGELITLGYNGAAMLPSVSSNLSHLELKEYFCYMDSTDGYLAIRDPNLIQKGAKLTLSLGGKVNASWVGSGPRLDNLSFESYLSPVTHGLSSSYVDSQGKVVYMQSIPAQRPPGPFIIHGLLSSNEYKGVDIKYVKWGIVKAGETINLELGKHIRSYEIKCLLPQNLPKGLKITLSLQPNPDKSSKVIPYLSLLEHLGKEEITRRSEKGIEEFYFKDWPLIDECFKFIADENWAKVNIKAQQGKESHLLQAVEFCIDEPQTKTVDLRNNKLLLGIISKESNI